MQSARSLSSLLLLLPSAAALQLQPHHPFQARFARAHQRGIATAAKQQYSDKYYELKAEGEATVARRAAIAAADEVAAPVAAAVGELADKLLLLKSEGEAVAAYRVAIGLPDAVEPAGPENEEKLLQLKAEGEAVVARRAEMTAAYNAAAAAAPVAEASAEEAAPAEVDEEKLLQLKAEGEAVVARRADMTAAYNAAAAKVDEEKLLQLKAEGEAVVARRAEMTAAYNAAAAAAPVAEASAGEAAPAVDEEKLLQLKAEGEAVVARRAEMTAAYNAAVASSTEDIEAVEEAPAPVAAPPAAPLPAPPSEQLSAPPSAPVEVVARAQTNPIPYPPPPPPPAVEAAGALVVTKPLPPLVVQAFESADLLNPAELPEDEQQDWLGAIGAGTLALFLLPIFDIGLLGDLLLSALLGGGVSGYVALRKDNWGLVSRSVAGKATNKAAVATYKLSQNVEETLQLTDKVKKGSKRLVEEVKKQL